MERRLFDDDKPMSGAQASNAVRPLARDPQDLSQRIQRSSLWAAYGDALGWISELTDEVGLKRRTKGEPLVRPVEWLRRVGGISGVMAVLPRGCYSDDSQLRLATGRSIRADGFDVEAFARVELPVWLSYELGGGKSTKAAAGNLLKTRVPWFANNFIGWTNSGGNGAAMRIQPHVWAAPTPGRPQSYLLDVIRNAVCSHSHPHGVMGAILHALTLAQARTARDNPTPNDLMEALNIAANLFDLIRDDMELHSYWRRVLERDGYPIDHAWLETVREAKEAVHIAATTHHPDGAVRFNAILDGLMLRDPSKRGSGMLTAIAAASLAWCEPRPEAALAIAANAIGSDTDTIASMAGAILGINASEDPPVEVLDADLFRLEAVRLSSIALGKTSPVHQYPDLLGWSAPKTRADALVRSQRGEYHVVGLGPAHLQGDPILSRDQAFMWQWVKLELGQTLFIKRRKQIDIVEDETIGKIVERHHLDDVGLSLGHDQDPTRTNYIVSQQAFQDMVDYLWRHRANDAVVGKVIRRVVNRCTPAQTAAFLAALIESLQEDGPRSK